MSIPRKGSRRIVVDGVEYCWCIRKKGACNQTDYGCGTLHVTVAAPGRGGPALVVLTDKPHPHDWATTTPVPVTPRKVTNWIRGALELGWWPFEKGIPFQLDAADGIYLETAPGPPIVKSGQ